MEYKNWKVLKEIEMKCGQTYVVEIGKNEMLEFSDVYLPNENKWGSRPYKYEDFGDISDKNKRVITICTMVGCYFNCQFCASKKTYQRNLSTKEIVGQVSFLEGIGTSKNRLSNLNDSKELHILFTRMGEPFANIKNVIEAIHILIERHPNIKIGLSTCGWEQGIVELLKHPKILPHIMMQFSIHGTDETTRSTLLGIPISEQSKLLDLKRIGKYVKEFRKHNPRMISFNFIIFEGFNYDFNLLKKYVGKEDIYLRLSPLNATENAGNKGLSGAIKENDVIQKKAISSNFLEKVIQNAKESGFNYSFAPAIDEEVKHKSACGQALEILKKEYL